MATRVEDTLGDLIAKHFRVPRTAVDLDLPIEEVPDSLKLSELIIDLEQRFDVALEDSAVARVRVLRDLIPLVEERIASAGRR
jgi:acyl carrier protein